VIDKDHLDPRLVLPSWAPIEVHAAPGHDLARNSVKRPVCDRTTHTRRTILARLSLGHFGHDIKRLISQNIRKFGMLAQILPFSGAKTARLAKRGLT